VDAEATPRLRSALVLKIGFRVQGVMFAAAAADGPALLALPASAGLQSLGWVWV